MVSNMIMCSDLLSRYKLWSVSALVIKLCPLQAISETSQVCSQLLCYFTCHIGLYKISQVCMVVHWKIGRLGIANQERHRLFLSCKAAGHPTYVAANVHEKLAANLRSYLEPATSPVLH